MQEIRAGSLFGLDDLDRSDETFLYWQNQLIENCTLSLDGNFGLENLQQTFGCFQIQNRLLEFGLAAFLTGDEKWNVHAWDTIKSLQRGKWLCEAINDEVRASYVLTGVLTYSILTDGFQNPETRIELQKLSKEIADWLFESSKTAAFGREESSIYAWNHAVVPASALGIYCDLYEDNEALKTWVDKRINGFLEHGITDKGVTPEGLFYTGFVFRMLGLYFEINNAANETDYWYNKEQNPYWNKLEQVPNWYLYNVFPGGKYLNNFNDSVLFPELPLMGFVSTFVKFNHQSTLEAWNLLSKSSKSTVFGVDSTFKKSNLFDTISSRYWQHEHSEKNTGKRKGVFFCKDSGQVVVRSGWEKEDMMFTFNSSPHLKGTHKQSDNNSFTYLSNGVPLLIDSGAANKPKEGSRSSSFGHNTILINGKGQLPAGRGRGSDGKIVRFNRLGEHRTIIVGDGTASFNTNQYNPIEAYYRQAFVSTAPLEFVLLVDEVVGLKDQEITISQLFQTLKLTKVVEEKNGLFGNTAFNGKRSDIDIRSLYPEEVGTSSTMSDTPMPYGKRAIWELKSEEGVCLRITLISPFRVKDVLLSSSVQVHDAGCSIELKWDGGLHDKFSITRVDIGNMQKIKGSVWDRSTSPS